MPRFKCGGGLGSESFPRRASSAILADSMDSGLRGSVINYSTVRIGASSIPHTSSVNIVRAVIVCAYSLIFAFQTRTVAQRHVKMPVAASRGISLIRCRFETDGFRDIERA